jgi:hypothetical protein
VNITEHQPQPETALFQPANLDELLDRADAETERLLQPVKQATAGLLSSDGQRVIIRSDRALQAAADALAITRRSRKELKTFWKDAPRKPMEERRPGEGWLFLVNKVRERLTTTFNKRDQYLEMVDGALDQGIKAYRAEVERRAREEAEVKAAAERARLEEQARQERIKAEEERSRLERIAQEERRRAEEEAGRRREAELAVARSRREKEEAERRAREAIERAAAEEEQQRLDADQAAARMRQEADDLEREAEDVFVELPEIPKPVGFSSRRQWKGEVVDFPKLVKAVAAGAVPINVLTVNESALHRLAEAWGGQNPPPGVRFVSREISTTRQRR